MKNWKNSSWLLPETARKSDRKNNALVSLVSFDCRLPNSTNNVIKTIPLINLSYFSAHSHFSNIFSLITIIGFYTFYSYIPVSDARELCPLKLSLILEFRVFLAFHFKLPRTADKCSVPTAAKYHLDICM